MLVRGATVAQVWALIVPAEHATALSDDVVRGFTVPGTPDGLGQQQCFTDTAGTTTIIEVVEYVEGHRAVTRTVSPRPVQPERTIHHVEPDPAGCRVTIISEVDTVVGAHWPAEYEQLWHTQMRNYLDRVAHIIATDPTGRSALGASLDHQGTGQ